MAYDFTKDIPFLMREFGEPIEINGREITCIFENPGERMQPLENWIIIQQARLTCQSTDVETVARGDPVRRPKTRYEYQIQDREDDGYGVTYFDLERTA